MNFAEYKGQVDRLASVYGKNAYPQERMQMLFYTVEEADFGSFQRQVGQWIQDSKAAPIGDQFREFMIKWRKTEIAAKKEYEASRRQPDCTDCSDTGWLSLEMFPALQAHSETYGYSITCSAICLCSRGFKIKSFCEASNDYKDVAKSIYKPAMHGQWYKITNTWKRDTYHGKSLEDWINERDGLVKSL
jgi:hypothetical protein